MIEQHIILAVLWILFCLFHSTLASVAVKKILFRLLKTRFPYYRFYYSLFAFISFGAVLFYQVSIPSPLLYRPSAGIVIIGSLPLLSGLIIMTICIRKYFGRMSGLKTLFIDERKTGNQLLITGVHRYVRHPLYLGTFLFIWGLFSILPYASLLIANLVINIYTLIGIKFEENKLMEEFGDQYRQYRKDVPKIIPRIGLR